MIKPRPCEKRFARGRFGGQSDVDSRRVGHAASNVGLNDIPRHTLVITHRELATASFMSGGASHRDVDGLTGFPSYYRVHVGGSGRVVDESLARINAVGDQRRRHRIVLGIFGSLRVEGGMQGIRP